MKAAYRACARVLASGAQPIEIATGPMELRLPGHGQPVAALQACGILLDGSTGDNAAGSESRLLLATPEVA